MTALTGVSATGARGTVTPVISIPLTGVAATITQGNLRMSTRPGESFFIVLPMVGLQLTGQTGAAGTVSLTPPAAQLSLTAQAPLAGAMVLSAPTPQVSFTAIAGVVGTVSLATPQLAIAFSNQGGLQALLPRPSLQLTGSVGTTAIVSLRPPLPALAFTGLTQTIGTLQIRPPMPQVTMGLVSGATGTLALLPPRPSLKLAGALGDTGTLQIAPLLPKLQLAGYVAASGTLAFVMPPAQLRMTGIVQLGAVQVAAQRTTYALQTERMALTHYTNFPFNSFAVFAGRYLGASDSGIFELVGADDAGTPIQAAARFGIHDLGTSMVKRVDKIYIGCRGVANAQSLLLRVTVDETAVRDYAVRPMIGAGLHTARVEMGKGVEARYWQFELQNRNGAMFTLDTLDVAPISQRRRYGANDA